MGREEDYLKLVKERETQTDMYNRILKTAVLTVGEEVDRNGQMIISTWLTTGQDTNDFHFNNTVINIIP